MPTRFIVFAPIDKPKIAVAIIVENGGYGSESAAPIVRKAFDYYLLGKRPTEKAAPVQPAVGNEIEDLAHIHEEENVTTTVPITPATVTPPVNPATSPTSTKAPTEVLPKVKPEAKPTGVKQ